MHWLVLLKLAQHWPAGIWTLAAVVSASIAIGGILHRLVEVRTERLRRILRKWLWAGEAARFVRAK